MAERLETAVRATELLAQKERVLAREQRRLVVLERVARRDWEDAWQDCQAWTARAVVLRGRRVVSLAAPRGFASVDLVWRNSMGAYYPAEAVSQLPDDARGAEIAGTAAILAATSASRRAVEQGVQHAAAWRALNEVEREVRATRRRSRMLRHQLLPALADSLRRVDLELEEREREDVVYARRARTREPR